MHKTFDKRNFTNCQRALKEKPKMPSHCDEIHHTKNNTII